LALLLENSRLLERDRERIYELSLLNSICSQMNHSLYDLERLRNIILQRMREIARVDVCALIEATNEAELPDWLPNPLWSLLIQQAHEQYLIAPLILTRNDEQSERSMNDYLALLPADIKTFIAMPLYRVRTANQARETTTHTQGPSPHKTTTSQV